MRPGFEEGEIYRLLELNRRRLRPRVLARAYCAQLFFDVFTSKVEICRTTFILPQFGHLIFFLA
jgi:hypothetical protein